MGGGREEHRGERDAYLLLAPTGALVLMMVYYIYIHPLFQIFAQSLDAIDVTSVTLKRLNSINADDVTRYFGDISRIFWGYFGDILGIF